MNDPAIIEAAARALFASEMPGSDWRVFPGLHDKFRACARAVLAARSRIEAEQEEPKQQVEEMKCSACGETRWLRKSMWHDTPICEPCFMVWYDPDESIDQTDPKAVGQLSMKLKAAGKAPWVGKYAD